MKTTYTTKFVTLMMNGVPDIQRVYLHLTVEAVDVLKENVKNPAAGRTLELTDANGKYHLIKLDQVLHVEIADFNPGQERKR